LIDEMQGEGVTPDKIAELDVTDQSAIGSDKGLLGIVC
jgi:hypothetical protein